MQSEHSSIIYWLAASQLFGPIKFRRWLNNFSDIIHLFTAPVNELQQAGLSTKEIKLLQNPDWDSIDRDLSWCKKNNCHLITIQDDHYPMLLREISDAPLILYIRGDLNLLFLPQIAMVGSRNPTVGGAEAAEQFARYLAKSGFVITSGLALGIDAASHRGALSAASGKTVAVMGTGLNSIYPPSHRRLAEEIIANGALVSEFPPNEAPKAKNFPRRNRIISGLSLGVLVVEAALHSGSLITARIAAEQGREVFAIPGSIHNPLVRGCHHLLRQGAKLVETADDIVEELGAFLDMFQKKVAIKADMAGSDDLSEKEQHLLSQLSFDTAALDTIIVRSGLTAGEVSSILLMLELKGYLQTVTGGYIRSTR